MKHTILLLLSFISLFQIGKAQTYGESISVQLEANVQASPAQIQLTWPADINAITYQVFRKAKTATSWGSVYSTLLATDTQFVDTHVGADTVYEYKMVMNPSSASIKYGYITSGINVRANSNRGIAIVVVEDSFMSNPIFSQAIDQLCMDLELDGWFPKHTYVHRTDLVTDVKTKITNLYNEDPSSSKLLLLVGHVPVPYSGNLNPDGHPDHQGAWPTDNYYADMDGDWTDVSINSTVAGDPRNQNIPGDGKFDQSNIPSDLELAAGRIDLANLPDFSLSEEALLLKYLDKLHRFKTDALHVTERGLIDDEFVGMPEGFSQNGYRNFSTLLGRKNIVKDDYFTQTSYHSSTTGAYKWSFGCGGGWYQGAGGIGSTTNFAADSLSAVFTMLFGSYFGDWDISNSFLRAPLAQGNTLTNCWAGRPNWHFHHMAMGEYIGYSGLLSQNNSSLYFASTLGGGMSRLVSMNFMGEPSLRDAYIISPKNLSINTIVKVSTLTWQKGADETGYNIYRRLAGTTAFEKLNTAPVHDTTFVDNTLFATGVVYYYVKAVKQHISPSGTYDNESLAAMDSTVSSSNIGIAELAENNATYTLYPNPCTNQVQIRCLNSELLIDYFMVTNLLGETIESSPIHASGFVLNTSNWNAGVYSLRLFGSNNAVLKLVKD